MIFYFTGTGNSLYAAQKLAELTADNITSIAEIMQGKPMPEQGDVTGIIYPIYAWSPPKIVQEFTKKYIKNTGYFYSVCTCGENCGRAMKRIEKAAGKALDSAYSITMPNNYMPGFDVDSGEEAAKKLVNAETRIAAIAERVNSRKTEVYDVVEGTLAGPLSAVISPMFQSFASSAKSFYAEESCTACGKCAAVCPTRNIKINGKPIWSNDCTMCFACINHCPIRAIQRGRGTQSKGRYVNPNCKVEYDF